jgi:hypothetical protein
VWLECLSKSEGNNKNVKNKKCVHFSMLPDPFERGQQAAVSRYFKIMKHASLFFLKL